MLHYGAHLPHIEVDKKNPAKNGTPKYISKPADRWRSLTKDFFLAPNGGLPFTEKHLKFDDKGEADYRKLKDHYRGVMMTVVQDIETGNQSGKEGDLSEMYQLVKKLDDETNEAEEVKDGKKKVVKDLKEKLDNTTDDIINGTKNNANKNTAVKIKMADGSIVIDEERAAKKAKQLSNSLDGKLLSFLDTMASQVTVSEEQRRANLSEVALRQLQQYIMFHGHCLEAFLFEAFSITTSARPPFELQETIQDMGGLDMLVEVYCSRDDNFEPGKFKNVLSEFGIGPKEARIMHVRLDRWRKDAALLEHEKKGHSSSARASTISDLTGATTTNSPDSMREGTEQPAAANPTAQADEHEHYGADTAIDVLLRIGNIG